MRDICKAIIDGGAEVAGVAGVALPGNLNMVANAGVEPTLDEARALLDANESYCKTVRAIVRGWLARTPEAAGAKWPLNEERKSKTLGMEEEKRNGQGDHQGS